MVKLRDGRAAALGRKPAGDDPRLADLRAREPDIGEAGRVCIEAWTTLRSTRPPISVSLGMSGSVMTSGEIPWPRIREWCEWTGLGRRETAIVASVLRRLDADRTKREADRIRKMASKG